MNRGELGVNQTDLHRIRRVSRAMMHICTASFVLIPAVLALAWANFDLILRHAPPVAGLRLPAGGPGALSLVLGFLVSLVASGILLFGLWRLRRLFHLYSDGRIFTAENAHCLRSFAWALVVFAVTKPLFGALLSVVVTWRNPPGQRALALSFGSNEFGVAFVGVLLLVIAWIMREGCRLAEDNAQIV